MSFKSFRVMRLLMILGVALPGCATPPRPVGSTAQPLVVNAQAGVPNRLLKGQLLALELASNASTGYDWEIVEDGSPVLQPAPVPASAKSPAAASLPGAGGTSQWRFLAAQPGTTRLRLVYQRPWEKEVAPARTASYSVIVE